MSERTMPPKFFVVMGYYDADWPLPARWKLLGAYSTIDNARDCARRGRAADERLTQHRIIGMTLDQDYATLPDG